MGNSARFGRQLHDNPGCAHYGSSGSKRSAAAATVEHSQGWWHRLEQMVYASQAQLPPSPNPPQHGCAQLSLLITCATLCCAVLAMQAAGYGKVVSHVIIGLKTVKGTKQLKLDPTIYDSLQKERVQVGGRGFAVAPEVLSFTFPLSTVQQYITVVLRYACSATQHAALCAAQYSTALCKGQHSTPDPSQGFCSAACNCQHKQMRVFAGW